MSTEADTAADPIQAVPPPRKRRGGGTTSKAGPRPVDAVADPALVPLEPPAPTVDGVPTDRDRVYSSRVLSAGLATLHPNDPLLKAAAGQRAMPSAVRDACRLAFADRVAVLAAIADGQPQTYIRVVGRARAIDHRLGVRPGTMIDVEVPEEERTVVIATPSLGERMAALEMLGRYAALLPSGGTKGAADGAVPGDDADSIVRGRVLQVLDRLRVGPAADA